MKRQLTLALAVVAFVAGVPAGAEVCSCLTPGPSCQATWEADAVFVAQVLEIQTLPRRPYRPGDVPEFGMAKRVRVRVVEAFRGGASGDIDLYTGAGGGDCGYDFTANETYLIYGNSSEQGRLTTGICSRTRAIEDADEDLAYLRNDARRDGVFSSIFGSAVDVDAGPRVGDAASREPVEDVHVVAESTRDRFEARTARDGTYSIPVPPGRYRISADLATPGVFVGVRWPEVEVRDARGCARSDFYVRSDGRIAGRIVDARGTPVARMRIDVLKLPAKGAPAWSRPLMGQHATTDEDGRFLITRLESANYSLVSAVLYPPQAPMRSAALPSLAVTSATGPLEIVLPDAR